jgi:hypothetical protein
MLARGRVPETLQVMDDDQSGTGISPAADHEGLGETLPVADHLDPYWRSISLQAAARVARFAELSATPRAGPEIGSWDIDTIEQRGRHSLVLGFVVGAVLYAGIMAFFVDMLRSPLALPKEIATTLALPR